MRSLFVVSLPRSLSSHVYHHARRALRLAEPVWTSDGELLNLDRFALGPGDGRGLKYCDRRYRPQAFEQVRAFLAQTVARRGFAYKDVVQPFVVSDWLPAARLAVLRIERPIADVALSMLAHGWIYPRLVADKHADPELQVLEGLVRARRALDAVAAVRVSFDALVEDEAALREALGRLYPRAELDRLHYLDDPFRRTRDTVLARRETVRYRELEDKHRWVEARLEATAGR